MVGLYQIPRSGSWPPRPLGGVKRFHPCSIQESGQRPRIHHISKFVTEKAQSANNPVFGGALYNDKDKDRGKNDKTNKKPSPPSTMGTTQATRGEIGSSSSAMTNDGVNENRQPSSRRRNIVSAKCLLCVGIH